MSIDWLIPMSRDKLCIPAVLGNNRKNMRNFLIFIVTILLTLTSCNNKKSQESQPFIAKIDSVKSVEMATEFLDLFKGINPNGLHIYPPTWDNKGNLNKTPFKGTPINVEKFSYVNNEEIFINLPACKKGLSHIYAIGKFEINSEYWGLIVRQYSQYDESLVQLLLWDKKQNKVFKGIDLADSFGDEGWYFDTESWIREYKINSTLKIVTRRKDSEFDGEFKNKTFTDSLKTNVFTNGKFLETHNELSDTANFKLKEWR